MKKAKLPVWLICLIFVAATLLFNLRYWLPITEESGERYTLTLEGASENNGTIFLDFGKSRSFHLVHAGAFDVLLEDEALGKEYEIIADYRYQRRNRSYYDVYALSCTDGTVYLTLEQSESIRQAMLPKRFALTLGLDAAVCALIIWTNRPRKKADHTKGENQP